MNLVVLKEKIELLSNLIIDLKNIAEDQSLAVLPKKRTFRYKKRGPNKSLELLFKAYNTKHFEGNSFDLAKKLNVTPDVIIKNLRKLASQDLIVLKEEHLHSDNNRLTLSGYITEYGISYIIEHDVCPI